MSRPRLFSAAVLASVISTTTGALLVVFQTMMSRISSLPPAPFAAMMIPIHVAIGIVEGILTGIIVLVVARLRPELANPSPTALRRNTRILIVGLLAAAVIIGGLISWFASSNPDGLEWSIARVAGEAEPDQRGGGVFSASAWLQNRLSFLPDYEFREGDSRNSATTVSGLIGGGITLGIVLIAGVLIRKKTKKVKKNKGEDAID